jgi:hypothetical protein
MLLFVDLDTVLCDEYTASLFLLNPSLYLLIDNKWGLVTTK